MQSEGLRRYNTYSHQTDSEFSCLSDGSFETFGVAQGMVDDSRAERRVQRRDARRVKGWGHRVGGNGSVDETGSIG